MRENSSSSGCRRLWSAPTHYITVSGQLHPSSVNVPARPTDGQLSGQRIHDLDLFTVVKPSGFNQQIGFLLFAQTFLHPPLVLCMCVSAKGVFTINTEICNQCLILESLTRCIALNSIYCYHNSSKSFSTQRWQGIG